MKSQNTPFFKKLILMVFLLNSYFLVQSQIKKGNFLAEANGNIFFSSKEKSNNSNNLPIGTLSGLDGFYLEKNASFSVNLGVGYAISKNHIIGLSVEYGKSTKDISDLTSSTIPISPTEGYTSYNVERSLDSKNTIKEFSSGIYYRHFIQITPKLFVSPRVDFRYQQINFVTNAEVIEKTDGVIILGGVDGSIGVPNGDIYGNQFDSTFIFPQPPQNNINKLHNEMNYNQKSIGAALSSQLMYQFNSRFGVQIKFLEASLDRRFKDSRFPNQNQSFTTTDFDINPKNWEYGVYFILGNVQ